MSKEDIKEEINELHEFLKHGLERTRISLHFLQPLSRLVFTEYFFTIRLLNNELVYQPKTFDFLILFFLNMIKVRTTDCCFKHSRIDKSINVQLAIVLTPIEI